MRKYHVTAIRDFLRCRRRWWYHYERGLEPGAVPTSWGEGSKFHAGIAAINRHLMENRLQPGAISLGKALELASKAMQQIKTGGDGYLIEQMIEYYWMHQGSKDHFDEIVAVESPLQVIIKDEICLVGTQDLVFQRGGRLVFRDYKTSTSVKIDPLYLRLDWQFNTYAWMLWQNYRGRDGKLDLQLEAEYVRRAVPHAKTKSGARSRTIDNPPSEYINRIPWPFSTNAMRRFESRLLGTLDDIERARQVDSWPRTDSRSNVDGCQRCPFFELCGDEQVNGDWDVKDLANLYTVKETSFEGA